MCLSKLRGFLRTFRGGHRKWIAGLWTEDCFVFLVDNWRKTVVSTDHIKAYVPQRHNRGTNIADGAFSQDFCRVDIFFFLVDHNKAMFETIGATWSY